MLNVFNNRENKALGGCRAFFVKKICRYFVKILDIVHIIIVQCNYKKRRY